MEGGGEGVEEKGWRGGGGGEEVEERGWRVEEDGGSGLCEAEITENNRIIPSYNTSGDGKLTLNVTTNSNLRTNMFYRATLFTAMNMIEAGSFLFCK